MSFLGLQDTGVEDTGDDPLLEAAPEEVSEPEEVAAPEAPATSPEIDQPAEAGEQEETTEEAEQRLYADRYQNLDQFERGYKELQGGFTRVVQELKQRDSYVEQLTQRQGQMEQAFQMLVPYLQRMQAEADPEAAEQMKRQMALAEQTKQAVDQQVAPLKQELQTERTKAAAMNVLQRFYAEHQDVAPESPNDRAVAATLQGIGGSLMSPWDLEVAYHAAQDPALYTVLRANPHLRSSAEGVAMAQHHANQLRQAAGQEAAPQRPQTVQRKGAHVETGGTGAPASAAPGQKPVDEFDEALTAYNERFSSVLLGSPRT